MELEDDDWESVDIDLKSLTFEREGTKSVIIPARLLTRPIDHDINFFQDVPSTSQNPPVLTIPTVHTNDDDPIDPALLDAVSNPRERMQVLNIEHSILAFVKSSSRTMEIPPVYNSFRRLLAYRIAQRFRIGHETSDYDNGSDQRVITLFKNQDTCFPRQLLIDLPVDVDHDQQSTGGEERNPQSHQASSSSAVKNPKKIVVLRKRPELEGNASIKSTTSKLKSPSNLADKERHYNEVRARIFKEETASVGSEPPIALRTPSPCVDAEDNTEHLPSKSRPRSTEPSVKAGIGPLSRSASSPQISTGLSSSNSKPKECSQHSPLNSGSKRFASSTVTAHGGKMTNCGTNGTQGNSFAGNAKGRRVLESSSQGLRSVSLPSPKPSISSPSNCGQSSAEVPLKNQFSPQSYPDTDESRNSKTVPNKKVDTGNWKEKKSTMRDIDAERSDPDFTRGNIAAAAMPYPPTASSGGNSSAQHHIHQHQHLQQSHFIPYGSLSHGFSQDSVGVYGNPQVAFSSGGMIPSGQYVPYPIQLGPTLQMTTPHQQWPSPLVISHQYYPPLTMGPQMGMIYPDPTRHGGYFPPSQPQGTSGYEPQDQIQHASSQHSSTSTPPRVLNKAEFPPLERDR